MDAMPELAEAPRLDREPVRPLPRIRPAGPESVAGSRWTPRRAIVRAREVAHSGGARVLTAKVAGELGSRRVILYESAGEPHPVAAPSVELAPLRVGEEASYLQLDPAADDVAVRRRLESGERCFVARAGERTVGAAWVARDIGHVDHARVAIDLAPGEAYLHGVLTAADWRGRGVGSAVFRSALAAMREEGVRRTYSVAVPEHPASVALNAACSDPVAVLTRRRIGSWIGVRVRALHPTARDWDAAAERSLERSYLDPRVAAVKRHDHLELLDRWLPRPGAGTLLKTDLWEEGVAGDELLFTLAGRFARVRGIDVSERVATAAAEAAAAAGAPVDVVRADIRGTAIADESVDVVVSTSTIDHLGTPRARERALAELHRVLVPGGTLILSVDNSENVGDPLLRVADRLGAVPFPLGPSMSLDELRDLVVRAGFEFGEHAYLVPAPRVVATLAVRALRSLGGRRGDRAVEALLRGFDAAGARAPRRLGCFVAVRAVKPPSR
jgi:SAM-dependent methyltransferase/GNAT superfamily N-acetyltransferase